MPSCTTTGNLLPLPLRFQSSLAFSSVATSTATNGTFIVMSNSSRREVAVMIALWPEVSEVRRKYVSESLVMSGTSFDAPAVGAGNPRIDMIALVLMVRCRV